VLAPLAVEHRQHDAPLQLARLLLPLDRRLEAVGIGHEPVEGLLFLGGERPGRALGVVQDAARLPGELGALLPHGVDIHADSPFNMRRQPPAQASADLWRRS